MKWNGTQSDFIELVKALNEAGFITESTQTTATELGAFFGLEIKEPYQLLKFIKKRKKTPFVALDKMQNALNQWKETQEKKHQRRLRVRYFDTLE